MPNRPLSPLKKAILRMSTPATRKKRNKNKKTTEQTPGHTKMSATDELGGPPSTVGIKLSNYCARNSWPIDTSPEQPPKERWQLLPDSLATTRWKQSEEARWKMVEDDTFTLLITAIAHRRMFDAMGPPIFSKWQHERADKALSLLQRCYWRNPPTEQELAECLCHGATAPTKDEAHGASTATTRKATDTTSR